MASTEFMAHQGAGQDLSDEQIEELLQQAEARLRGEQSTLSLVPTNSAALVTSKRLQAASLPAPPVQTKRSIARADPKSLVTSEEQKLASQGIRKVEDPVVVQRKKLEDQKATAGAQWYNIPKTDLTPQLKRDLQVLRMRTVLDPHRHYKKDNSKATVPEFSQIGKIVEGPTEFYSARIPKRERGKTLAQSVMEGERDSGRMKRKYNELQERKRSGKRGHYKKLMQQRYKGRYEG